MNKISNLLKLACLCALFNAAVVGLELSPFTLGILSGLLGGAAFILGYNDGTDNLWKIIFEIQKQMDEAARQVIDQSKEVDDDREKS